MGPRWLVWGVTVWLTGLLHCGGDAEPAEDAGDTTEVDTLERDTVVADTVVTDTVVMDVVQADTIRTDTVVKDVLHTDTGARDTVVRHDGWPQVSIASYPRVDGSTSNIPLAWTIACELLGLSYGYIYHRSSGSTPSERVIVPFVRDDEERALAVGLAATLVHNKTHEAYLRLIDGQVDLILVASAPSPDERAYASKQGVTLTWDTVALDALVFMVDADSSITDLTLEQIRGIFSGQLTRWSQVGGPDVPIQPYTRPSNSGSQQLLETFVMQGLGMPEWPPDQVPTFMGGLVEALKNDPDGIGFSVYYYVTHQYDISGLALVAIDGVRPTHAALADGTYPVVAPVLVVVRDDLAPESLAAQLRAWLLTPEGQGVVAASGYVPVIPVQPTSPLPHERPACAGERPSGHACDLWSRDTDTCHATEGCHASCDGAGGWIGECRHVDEDEVPPFYWCGGCAQGSVCTGGWSGWCAPVCDPWAGRVDAGRCPVGQRCFHDTRVTGFNEPEDVFGEYLQLEPVGYCAPSHVVGAWDCPRGQWCPPRERGSDGRWRCICEP
ncbi:MAG: hypothetical protein EP329_11020 [Deltaproteobacteria bacterium]|nr:MAG: hypothetical protein EP329_11020 [Deltaproteobacteria bacterium]